jgi:hypothetical protein
MQIRITLDTNRRTQVSSSLDHRDQSPNGLQVRKGRRMSEFQAGGSGDNGGGRDLRAPQKAR